MHLSICNHPSLGGRFQTTHMFNPGSPVAAILPSEIFGFQSPGASIETQQKHGLAVALGISVWRPGLLILQHQKGKRLFFLQISMFFFFQGALTLFVTIAIHLFCVSNTSSCLFSFVVVFCFLSVYRHVLSSEVGAQVGVAVGIVAEVAEVEVD